MIAGLPKPAIMSHYKVLMISVLSMVMQLGPGDVFYTLSPSTTLLLAASPWVAPPSMVKPLSFPITINIKVVKEKKSYEQFDVIAGATLALAPRFSVSNFWGDCREVQCHSYSVHR